MRESRRDATHTTLRGSVQLTFMHAGVKVGYDKRCVIRAAVEDCVQ